MKRFKKLLYLLIVVATAFVFYIQSTPKVEAASGTISISANKSQVVVGNTVTFTVRVSSGTGMVSLLYNISYDSSRLTLTSGNASGAPTFSSPTKNVTYTFTFKAKKSGTATLKFSCDGATWSGDSEVKFSTQSKSVTVITQQQLENSYSKNNYLSKLAVDGQSISPKFNKDTLTYSLVVENNVRKINVTGTKEDSRSSVSGLGSHTLEEGSNVIKIVVTAQNGSSRTYTLNVTVKELTPIVVAVGEDEMNVVRKKELIEKPNSTYDDVTIKINEEDVPAFYNEVTDTTLVGLKDKDGNIALYIYKDGSYQLYNEYSFDSLIVTQTDLKDVPKGYVEATLKIGEEEIKAYKEKDNDEFYLFSAVNITTGKEHIYQYNTEENTIQIYNSKSIDKLNNNIKELETQNKNYLYVIVGLGSLLIITYFLILISSFKRGSKRKYKKIEAELKKEEQKKIEGNRKKEEIEEKEIKEEKDVDELSPTNDKKEKVHKEIEKKKKKDDKIKEDISSKSKRKKK